MIITKTPFRVSLFGGGTDLPKYYSSFGGATLSFTIRRHMYITIHPRFNDGFRISYSQVEDVKNIAEINHTIARASLEMLEVDFPLEISSIAEIPSYGSGLGSSSAYTVGLINAIETYKGTQLTPVRLAELATHVEIDLCNEPIGKQDQYAAAIGGGNFLEYNQNGSVTVTNLNHEIDTINQLFGRFLLLYTGVTRSASKQLIKQQKNMNDSAEVLDAFHQIKDMAYQGLDLFRQGDLDAIGTLLDKTWHFKRKFDSNITNSRFELAYEIAKKNGALGGKILGAGGGGFFLFYAPPECHEDISSSLPYFKQVDIQFEPSGSSVILEN